MRESRQIGIITSVLKEYIQNASGRTAYLPLHFFLKEFFRKNRQMGSKDRKNTSSLLYDYFRLGNSLATLKTEEKMAIACFLCEQQASPLLKFLIETFSGLDPDEISNAPEDKLESVAKKYADFNLKDIFPFSENLSDLIDRENFFKSFLIRPKVWIRMKRGYEDKVLSEFRLKEIIFEVSKEFPLAVSVENATSLEGLQSRKKKFFEIQDLFSQGTAEFFQAEKNEEWWDCCAGSGGKSLLLKDAQPSIQLLASDIRPQIIENLKSRFSLASIRNYSTEVIDLFTDKNLPAKLFDGIIADVPCSGSGTWGRTPEMLSFFRKEDILNYREKQRSIVEKASLKLKKNKPLVYITCSVFKEENEEQIEYFEKVFGLKADRVDYLRGYTKKADTLFAARLIKQS